MNRDNNAPFADRAPREGGKPAFRGSAHGEGKPAFRRDSETRPPRKPKGSVRGAQPSGSQGFAANPPYRPWGKHPQKAPAQAAKFVSPIQTATCAEATVSHQP